MKWTEGSLGRVFVLRLNDGEILHLQIENFAAARRIRAAAVIAVGAADSASVFVVGPRRAAERPVRPMERRISDVRELAGVGTIFPDRTGRPVLHMHVAAGRCGRTITGCVRRGVRVWQVMEVVILELKETAAARLPDALLGFSLLEPGRKPASGRSAKKDRAAP